MRSHRWRSVPSSLNESAHGCPELVKHALLVGPERASGGAGRSAVRVKPEQAPQGATGRGLGWCRGPQVDRAA